MACLAQLALRSQSPRPGRPRAIVGATSCDGADDQRHRQGVPVWAPSTGAHQLPPSTPYLVRRSAHPDGLVSPRELTPWTWTALPSPSWWRRTCSACAAKGSRDRRPGLRHFTAPTRH